MLNYFSLWQTTNSVRSILCMWSLLLLEFTNIFVQLYGRFPYVYLSSNIKVIYIYMLSVNSLCAHVIIITYTSGLNGQLYFHYCLKIRIIGIIRHKIYSTYVLNRLQMIKIMINMPKIGRTVGRILGLFKKRRATYMYRM